MKPIRAAKQPPVMYVLLRARSGPLEEFLRRALRRFFLGACVALLSFAPQVSAKNPLKQLSLDQLGQVEVITKAKAPGPLRKTAAAIYVITQDDIRRSGVT